MAADAILQELQDPRKATYKYLRSSNTEYSFHHCSEEKRRAFLGKKATNNEYESTLGGTTSQIQRYSRVGIANAAAISEINKRLFLPQANWSKEL